MKNFDIAIVGSGPGGYSASLRAASHGKTVALIEKGDIGGACLNRGCVPAKAWIAAAETMDHLKFMNSIAVEPVDYKIDFKKVVDRQRSIVSSFRKSLETLLNKKGVEIFRSEGRFISANAIELGNGERIEFKNAVIATGSSPAKLFPDLDDDRMLDSDSIFDMDTLPGSLMIIGGGAIGCEFAGAFARFGVDVSIIEMEPRILPVEDHEISSTLAREFKKSKIKIVTGVTINSIKRNENSLCAVLDNGSEVVAQKALIAAGRNYHTGSLGLDSAGVKVGARGEIVTDDTMRTSAQNIFAVGDVAGKNMLAYTAYKEGEIAVDLMAGKDAEPWEFIVPNTIFTIPEVGSVGLTEQDAPEGSKTGSFMFRSLARAHSTGELTGFVKLVADPKTDRLLGAHIIGPRATDLIHIASVALSQKMTAKAFSRLVFAHPTFAEAMVEAAQDIDGASLHK